MEKLNRCIIGLGSNYDKEANTEKAISLLKLYFNQIQFSVPVLTSPIPENNYTDDYLNCVAVARTAESREIILTYLKETEKLLGRTPDSKQTGIIPIDLDLLQWNEEVLKDELSRYYIQQGLQSLY
ncbi:MAG: 2-amino-4-hydroxy-6-hydroxymethyldihydropteridine diphosphokinase [Tannerellaceae bacterium]|nr:2-amino-4-hydroxy-6-hydroxymethyldihydropteridine diphosphokinase [Tannerellaceae bacterium]